MGFRDDCYVLLKRVPHGRVTSYSQIANALNSRAYRAVGAVMKNNPSPIIVPCHRVVMSDGSLGGYVFGVEKKKELLEGEGITIVNNKVVGFSGVFFSF